MTSKPEVTLKERFEGALWEGKGRPVLHSLKHQNAPQLSAHPQSDNSGAVCLEFELKARRDPLHSMRIDLVDFSDLVDHVEGFPSPGSAWPW